MLATGDVLSVQLALFGAALAVGGIAATQAGWSGQYFVRTCFAFAIILFITAIFWAKISSNIALFSDISAPPAIPYAITTLFTLYICFRFSKRQTSEAKRETAAASLPKASRRNCIVKDSYIYSGVRRSAAPRFVGKFCENGRDARFYIEYSFLPTNVMGSVKWSNRRKIEIYEKSRYAKDEDVIFDIAYQTESSGRVFWHFGRENRENEPLLDKAFYRGRISVTVDNRDEQHIYFFMKYNFANEDGPELIGEHIFDVPTAWSQFSG